MWTRKELKTKGKAAFKANYWRSVLVALLIVFVLGSGLSAARSGNNSAVENGSAVSETDTAFARLSDLLEQMPAEVAGAVLLTVVGAIGGAVVTYILIDVLVLNPLEVGCRRFYVVNCDEPAGLGELGYGYRNSYGNVVQTGLLRDIYLFLWSLLFIIPGTVKRYSYRLVPYILAEDPAMKPKEAITLSRSLMKGHKWRAFVLDLSFIGWDILSGLTFGLVGVFYSNPYQCATNAELYKAIRGAD